MTDETQNLPAVQSATTAVAMHRPLDDARFDRVMREAEAAYHSTFLPTTLTKDDTKFLAEPQIKANCFVVASVAHDMGVGFMAVAQSMSQVHGKLMFEGKLIAAVIEQRLGVRLRKTYTGEPGTDSYGIKVWTKEDEAEGFEPIDGTVGEWKTKERSGEIKKIWVGANKQKNQLFYMGARVWARLNAPGLMLGIVGDDEVDEAAVAEPAAPVRISAGFASQDPAPGAPADELASADDMAALSAEWGVLRKLEADAQVGTAFSVAYDQPLMIDAPHKPTRQQVRDYLGTVSSHINRLRDALEAAKVKAEAKVDEKPPADAEMSQQAKKASIGKGKKVDEKPKGVSKNLMAALEVAAEELSQVNAMLEMRGLDGVGTWAINSQDNDDAAQAMLGEMNAAADRGKTAVRTFENAKGESLGARQQAADATPAQIIKSLDDVLRPLTSWAKIKETFSGFAKLNDWKGLGKADKAKVYAMVWSHANRLNVALTGKGEAPEVHPTDDATAYRCAIEACDDAGILSHMWEAVKASASYNGQTAGTKTALVEATEARLKQLKG